jgi:WD40 repeat protein/Flp pilus assembly protein TadD
VRLWDPCSGELRTILRGHDDLVMRVGFDASGNRLASAGWDRTVRLWDPIDGRMLATLVGADDNVVPIAFSPDGAQLVAGDVTSHVKLWDVADPDPGVVRVRGKWLWKLRFWPDGESVLAVHGGWAHRYATSSDRVLAEYPYEKFEWRGADVAPDGQSVALGDSAGGLRVVSADSSVELARAQTDGHGLLALDWSSDGAVLAGGCEDGFVYVFEGAERTPRKIASLGVTVHALAFGPRDDAIAVVGARGELRVLDARDGTVRWTGEPSFSAAHDLAWSPDGRHIAIALGDGRLAMWDAATHAREREFLGHTAGATAIAFSPDGSRLASGSDDRSIRLWEPRTGRELANLIEHAYLVEALAFSPDGSTLVSGSSDSTLRWWRARSEPERAVAERARTSFLGREVRAQIARDTTLDPRVRERAEVSASALVDDPRELVREAWIAAAAPRSEPNRLRDALARAQIALRYLPDDPHALHALAAAQSRLGDDAAALATLERCTELDAHDTLACALRALALAHAGRDSEARAALEQASAPSETARPRDPALGRLTAEVKAALASQ